MEAYSLKESLKFLDFHIEQLNEFEYLLLKSIIANHALEGMYANEQDIAEMIAIIHGNQKTSSIIMRHLRSFEAGQTPANYLIALNQLLGPKNLDSFAQALLLSVQFPVKSFIELQQKQKMITLKTELSLRIGSLKGDLSYDHLKNIHRTLFVDIYKWAGKDRYEMDMMGQFGKNDTVYCMGSLIPKEANILFGLLKNADHYQHIPKQEWIECVTLFYADLDHLQPFREGNGQVIRIFINEIAKLSGYMLDLSFASKQQLSHALMQAHEGNISHLKALISNHLKTL